LSLEESMFDLLRFRPALTSAAAALLPCACVVVLGRDDAAASDMRSRHPAQAPGASAVPRHLTAQAWVNPPDDPQGSSQPTTATAAVQAPASADPPGSAEARVAQPAAAAPVSDVRPAEGPAAAAAPSTPARRGPAPTEVATYIDRAHAKIQQGDIAAARRLLERASDSDAAEAWFALAETYDPQMLARWGVLGVRPDLEKARSLYQKAEARGAKGARERLLAIRQ
jgi:hypothetical protein